MSVLRFPPSNIEEVVERLLERIRAGEVHALAFVAAKGRDSWTFFDEVKPNHVTEINMGLDLLKNSILRRIEGNMEICARNEFEPEST